MLRYLSLCFFFLTAWNPLSAATVVVTTGDGGNFFSPAHFVIKPGDTVLWVWKDGHHNTSSYSTPAGAGAWYSNLNNSDTQFWYIPAVSGLYQYTCTHHSAMDGSFFVTGCAYPDKPLISGTWKTSPCDGMAAILLRTPSQAGATYQWLRSGILVAGAHTDSLLTMAASSCRVLVNRCGVDSLSEPFIVASYPLPVPAFSFTATGLHYTFTNTSPGKDAYLFHWNFGDGSPEVTGTDAEHTFSKSGTYTVRLLITDLAGNCPDSTAQTLHTTLSISSSTKESTSIQPNPSSGVIDIRCAEACSVKLYDLSGNILLAPGEMNTLHHLDLAGLPAGPYLLLFRTLYGETFTKHILVY